MTPAAATRSEKPRHCCHTPAMPQGLTVPLQPDWTCAACGRIWRDTASGPVRWWAEIRGPTHFPRGETL